MIMECEIETQALAAQHGSPVLSRRNFIAMAGVAAGAVAVGGLLPTSAWATEAQEIELGEEIATDDYTFTVGSYSWVENIYPPDTSNGYTYHKGEEGKHYFLFRGTFKNTAASKVALDDISEASFVFNGKYTYDGTVEFTASDANMFNQYYVDPLETVELYLYAQVPDELMDGFDTVELTWDFYAEESSWHENDPVATYMLTYSQAQADEAQAQAEAAAQGVPLNGLMLEGIRVDLSDDLYAFQLEGHQGFAWPSDGSGSTVAIEKGEGYELPSTEAERETFFANRIAEYATSVGWTVTKSEPVELADKLEGHLNQADHGDGWATTYINIPLNDSDFIQVYIVYLNVEAGTALVENVTKSIRKQTDDDDVPVASNQVTTAEALQITFQSPVSQSAVLSYDALYSFDYDRTLQILVEPFDENSRSTCMLYAANPASEETWGNCADEGWFLDNYCQQFAAARGGWVMSSFTTPTQDSTATVCVIRADQEVGGVVYVLVGLPGATSHTQYNVLTARCMLSSARKWSPSIDAMIKSIAYQKNTTILLDSFTHSVSQKGWTADAPGCTEQDELAGSDHSSVMYIDSFGNSSVKLSIFYMTYIAHYGYYYQWSLAGDKKFEDSDNQLLGEWTLDTDTASMRIRKGASSSSFDRDIVIDIHSSSDNALAVDISYGHEDEEFLTPTFMEIINSIDVYS